MLPANFFENTKEQIISKIKTAPSTKHLMDYICYTHENIIIIDYQFFKYIACEASYELILNHYIQIINGVLSKRPTITICMCVHSLTISDVEKHYTFIKNTAQLLSITYQDKLDAWYIYKAPFIFSQIYNIVSLFIDKTTQRKIVIVD